MNLRAFLKSRRIAVKAAAEDLGVTRPYFSDILSRKHRPGPHLTLRIEAWSEGAVPRWELRPDLWPPPAHRQTEERLAIIVG